MIHAYLSIAGLRFLSMVLAACFIGIVTYAVKADDFGRFSLLLSFVQVLGTATLSFCNLALLRYAREEFNRTESIGETLGTRLALHVFLLAVVLPVAWMLFPWVRTTFDLGDVSVFVLLFGLLVIPFNEMGTVTAQSVDRYVGFGLSPLVFRVVQIVTLGVMLFLAIHSWEALAVGTLIGYGLSGMVAWTRVPTAAIEKLRFSFSILKKFMTYSWSIPFALLAVVLLNWLDLWIIQYFYDATVVGVYAWAYNVSLLAAAMLAPLGALMSTGVIDLAIKKQDRGFEHFSLMANSVFYFAACIFPILAVFFGLIFEFVPLGAYGGAVIPAQILIMAIAFQTGRVFWEAVVFAHEKIAPIGAGIMVGMAVVNAALDFLFVPIYGPSGAAISTAIAFAIGMFGLYFIVRVRVAGVEGSPLATCLFAFIPFAMVIVADSFDSAVFSMLGLLGCLFFTVVCRRIGMFKGLPNLLSLELLEDEQSNTITARVLRWLANEPLFDSAKPKLLVVVNHLGVGGTERHLLQVLPHLVQQGIKIQLLVLRAGGRLEPQFEEQGIELFRPSKTASIWMQRASAFYMLVSLMIKERPQIAHFFLPEAYLVGGVAAVLTGVSCRIMSRRSLNNYQEKHPVFSYLERQLHLGMSACLGNSKKVCQQLSDEGVSAERIRLIYNGVEAGRFDISLSKRQAREKLNIPYDAVAIVIVANLIPYKGHIDLLTALGTIKHELGDDWVLLCAGRDDGIGRELKEVEVCLGLQNHIRWLGEYDDTPALYRASDIGVLCSHEEGFSNSILEYMACGLPVIATTVGGNTESVEHGKTGFLVPPSAAKELGAVILELYGDSEKRKRMGDEGREVVINKFTVEKCVDAYHDFYCEVSAGYQESTRKVQAHA